MLIPNTGGWGDIQKLKSDCSLAWKCGPSVINWSTHQIKASTATSRSQCMQTWSSWRLVQQILNTNANRPVSVCLVQKHLEWQSNLLCVSKMNYGGTCFISIGERRWDSLSKDNKLGRLAKLLKSSVTWSAISATRTWPRRPFSPTRCVSRDFMGDQKPLKSSKCKGPK